MLLFNHDQHYANTGQVEVTGPVDFIHQWINMTNYVVQLANGSLATTCKAALGYSFAAGTTDGPGEFDFTQGSHKCILFSFRKPPFLKN
jgi:neutral ceramidase